MKKLLLALCLLVVPAVAHAQTVVITAGGFATWPVTAPVGWPSTLTWPPTGSTSPNTARTLTINNADLISILTWVAAANQSTLCPASPPCSVTGAQLLSDWLQMSIVIGTKQAVQQFQTPAPAPPAQVTIQ